MSDLYQVIYSPVAVDDIRDIYSYIALELLAPEAAQNQVNRIRGEIRSLDFMPKRHPFVEWEPWKSMRMHKAPVDNYVVYYTVNDQALVVTVVRIFYSGRDVEGMMGF